jgi:lipopolysaccharide export system permease protein
MRILHRYVLMELLRVFVLLALGLTILLVFVGVAGEAAKNGLGPSQIQQILPWIIPSLFPFTIPATLLLTVCVVYGRMAGDQEITAIKSAGISVMTVLWPSFILGSVLSLCTFVLTDRYIPLARGHIEAIITNAMEDIFLDILRTKNQFTDIDHGIAITVRGVDGKRLIQPTFRYAPYGGEATTVAADGAHLKFDMARQEIILVVDDGHIETPGGETVRIEHEEFRFPLPSRNEAPKARNISIENIRRELSGIDAERQELDHRRIFLTAFALSTGNYKEIQPDPIQQHAFQRRLLDERRRKLHTEIHSRLALACSCFFFVLVGSPFAIMQGKRQFLTSFAICFAPILAVYYPIVMLTMHLAKDDKINPSWGLWIGNVGLGLIALFILRRVTRH